MTKYIAFFLERGALSPGAPVDGKNLKELLAKFADKIAYVFTVTEIKNARKRAKG